MHTDAAKVWMKKACGHGIKNLDTIFPICALKQNRKVKESGWGSMMASLHVYRHPPIDDERSPVFALASSFEILRLLSEVI